MAHYDSPDSTRKAKPVTGSAQGEILRGLVSIASSAVNAQLTDFVGRLVEALMKCSEESFEPKHASLTFNAANLLKKNIYAFHFLATSRIQKALRHEIEATEPPVKSMRIRTDEELSLVTYADMEKTLLLSNMARPLDTAHADQLTALRLRVAHLLGREELSNNQNPFRPEVLLNAINEAWQEFNPDPETHGLVLPLFRPEIFVDLAPVFGALNDELIASGVLPELSEFYNIKKTTNNQPSEIKAERLAPATLQQLRQLFSPQQEMTGLPAMPAIPMIPGVPMIPGLPGATEYAEYSPSYVESAQSYAIPSQPGQPMQAAISGSQLISVLAGLQQKLSAEQSTELARGVVPNASILGSIKTSAPQGSLTRIDESTIDLLTKIFDVVFRDQNIPSEIKGLIGFLQVPVLKAALVDKEFFFKEEHPARRVIELLTKASIGWDQKKGQEDPLFQAIKRSVDRIQSEFEHQEMVFADVAAELESFVQQEESAAAQALSEPIAQALKQEKLGAATKAAKTDVAMRIGTGEVVAFVETFLENKWTRVLTLAYSVKDEKPQALENAIKTMDDLIWSVKPKITMEERKELVAKLPSMLAALNKWLDLVKLDDAERLQFFAELAECHASIVRAPLEMSPQRRLEIAMEVAKEAAERRQQKKLEQEEKQKLEPEPVADDFTNHVEQLERGMWFEFTQEDTSRKVKLSWVSPLRTLYIFSSKDKSESFSLSTEDLVQAMREGRAKVILLGGLIDRAITEALEHGANDADINEKSAA